jgi:histidinol-phosphate aminotransferase
LSEWVRERLKAVVQEGYAPIVDLESITQRIGVAIEDLIRLDLNENLFFPEQSLSSLLKEMAVDIDVRTYPRLEEKRLVESLANYLQLPSDHIVLSNGSLASIDSVVRNFLKTGESVLTVSPTFDMYEKITKSRGYGYVGVWLNSDFSLNADALLSGMTESTVLCILSSPNNPTGNQFKRGDVERVIEEFKGFVVIDEAYVDYGRYSVIDMIAECENMMILRTFSKAFGLAGLRVGYSIANPKISEALRSTRLPVSVNKASMIMARKVLELTDEVKDVTQRVKSERNGLVKRMNRIHGVTAFDSDTNFIFFKTVKDPEEIHYSLQNRGILIRRFSNILDRGDFLRVTVGLPGMNAQFLEALKEICEEKS